MNYIDISISSLIDKQIDIINKMKVTYILTKDGNLKQIIDEESDKILRDINNLISELKHKKQLLEYGENYITGR